jgi:MFS family permease
MWSLPFCAIFLIGVCGNLSSSIYYMYPAELIRLGIDSRDIGSIMGAFFWGAVLGVPLSDWLMRVVGGRFVFALGLSALVLASLELSTAISFWPAFAGRLLHGIGWTALSIAGTVSVAAIAPPDRLAKALTLFGLAFVFGQGIAPLVASLVGEASFAPAFYFAAAIAAFASLALPFVPAPVSARAARWPSWRCIRLPLITTVLLVAPSLATISLVTATAAAVGFVGMAPWFFVCLMLATTLARIGGAGLLDRFNRNALIGGAAVVACLGQISLIGLAEPWQLLAAGLLNGISASIYMPSLQALLIDRSRDRIAAVTSFRGVVEVSGGIGASLGGLLANATNYSTRFGLGAILSILGSVFILCDAGRDAAK